jgi:(1->4)-alpha-D-glucan 1-alpha-D-glucosylmutase
MVNDRLAPDANEEYLLYQILLGSWPTESGAVDQVYVERIQAYVIKALSEAKAHTNWSNPDNAWLEACKKFVATILDPKLSSGFLDDFVPFAEELSLRGRGFSLVQTVLKLTAPGVPDIYQGTEMWDLSLVDPDNRRPVDYAVREMALKTTEQASVGDLLETWKDGRIKLKVIRMLLRFRASHPLLFSQGSYVPVAVAGPDAARIVAFLRRNSAEQLLVVAACSIGAKAPGGIDFPDAQITLPVSGGTWRELLTGRTMDGAADLHVRDLLRDLPVAVFSLETK